MSMFLPVKETNGTFANAICYRCKFALPYGDLKQDPNDLQWYCKDCVDVYDPWKLPAPKPENIALHHPRPDGELK